MTTTYEWQDLSHQAKEKAARAWLTPDPWLVNELLTELLDYEAERLENMGIFEAKLSVERDRVGITSREINLLDFLKARKLCNKYRSLYYWMQEGSLWAEYCSVHTGHMSYLDVHVDLRWNGDDDMNPTLTKQVEEWESRYIHYQGVTSELKEELWQIAEEIRIRLDREEEWLYSEQRAEEEARELGYLFTEEGELIQ